MKKVVSSKGKVILRVLISRKWELTKGNLTTKEVSKTSNCPNDLKEELKVALPPMRNSPNC